MARSRSPEIMADAAHAILSRPSREFTGQFVLDELLLREQGVTDFSHYQVTPGGALTPDLFVSDEELDQSGSRFGRRK